jgi:hypothetical protein
LEKQALRYANRLLTPNQLDSALITDAHIHSLDLPIAALPETSHNSQDDVEVAEFV